MDLELPVVLGVFVGVAAIGYMLGRRGVERRLAADAAVPTTPAPPSAEDDDESEATKEESEAKAASEGRREATEKATAAHEEQTSGEILKVSYDDEDDELDLTKVGSNASGSGPPGAVRTIYQPPVVKIVVDEEANDAPVSEREQTLFLVHATAQTDPGLRRKRNEDSLLVLPTENLFAVADGMGGHRGGELASKMAIEAIQRAATTKSFEGPPHEALPAEASELARAIQMANADIQEYVAKNREMKGMGTTIVSARFLPTRKRVYIGHVGDSRCYRMRDGVMKLLTADHTMADHGFTGPDSAALSRAVGIWSTMPIDILLVVPQLDDVYLLCSDGLTKMLPDETIANVLRSEEDPKVAVERLILFANAHGGKDNITVVLVRVVPPNFRPKSASQADA